MEGRMIELRGMGCVAFFICAIAILVLAAALFFSGVAYVSAIIMPWLLIAAWITFGILLIVFLPLSFFRRSRRVSCTAFITGSYMFGICGWLLGFLTTYTVWGFWALIVGLFLFGIGVVPIGIAAAAFHGVWDTVWELLLLVVLTFAARGYAVYLANRVDRDIYERHTITLKAR